jgi:hypothetical protein
MLRSLIYGQLSWTGNDRALAIAAPCKPDVHLTASGTYQRVLPTHARLYAKTVNVLPTIVQVIDYDR